LNEIYNLKKVKNKFLLFIIAIVLFLSCLSPSKGRVATYCYVSTPDSINYKGELILCSKFIGQNAGIIKDKSFVIPYDDIC
jgi:hypothetical protein